MSGLRGGELFIVLLALAFLALLPIVIGAVIFFAFKRAKKNRTGWQQLATKLNMSVAAPSGLGLTGTYRERPVDISVAVRGGSESREVFTYSKASFRHDLRLLLGIETRGFVGSILGSGGDAKIGSASFDDAFSAFCYDHGVLREFLLTELPSVETSNLLGDLILAQRTGLRIRINDAFVCVERSGDSADEDVVRQMLDTAVRLADRFDAVRRIFPLAAWEIQAFENWNRVAGTLGMTFSRDDFRISGVIDGFRIEATVKSDRQKWQTILRVDFPSSLATGLQIMPENSIHRAMAWVGAQDIRVGIEDFDAAFVVKAKNETVARQKLGPDVCRGLVGLKNQSDDLRIDDTSLSATFAEVVGDPQKLHWAITTVVAIAKMLGR